MMRKFEIQSDVFLTFHPDAMSELALRIAAHIILALPQCREYGSDRYRILADPASTFLKDNGMLNVGYGLLHEALLLYSYVEATIIADKRNDEEPHFFGKNLDERTIIARAMDEYEQWCIEWDQRWQEMYPRDDADRNRTAYNDLNQRFLEGARPAT